MRNFWSYISNGEYSVGCTGQTVYLYDKDNNEIAKFKDLKYAYTTMISPNGKIFVVKSTEGRLAVYSLETFSLIKKFRFSKLGGQDGGFCFSPNGELFFNIELHKDGSYTVISVYDATDFTLINQCILSKDILFINHIEFDTSTYTYYVLGSKVDVDKDIGYGFVAKFVDYQLKNITPISESEYDFYSSYKSSELTGFASKDMFSLIGCDTNKLKKMNHTLAKLFAYYNK